jgi:uncharacterized DUF497 family protein
LEIKFSKHALKKLEDSRSKRLEITKESIKMILSKPDLIDNSDYPLLMAVGRLHGNLSLCIIYKFVEEDIKVITFFPAERGRYESKILFRR